MLPDDPTPPRNLMKEILEDFVEYIDASDDRQSIAELAQHAFLEARRVAKKEADYQRGVEKRIRTQHTEEIVCPACGETFSTIVGKRGRPRKWHTQKCKMNVLRARKRADNPHPQMM